MKGTKRRVIGLNVKICKRRTMILSIKSLAVVEL